MKAKCINDAGWVQKRYFKILRWLCGEWEDGTGPKEGEIVTVVNEYWEEGELYYILKEWPLKHDEGFEASQFVPLKEGYNTVKFEEIKEKSCIN